MKRRTVLLIALGVIGAASAAWVASDRRGQGEPHHPIRLRDLEDGRKVFGWIRAYGPLEGDLLEVHAYEYSGPPCSIRVRDQSWDTEQNHGPYPDRKVLDEIRRLKEPGLPTMKLNILLARFRNEKYRLAVFGECELVRSKPGVQGGQSLSISRVDDWTLPEPFRARTEHGYTLGTGFMTPLTKAGQEGVFLLKEWQASLRQRMYMKTYSEQELLDGATP